MHSGGKRCWRQVRNAVPTLSTSSADSGACRLPHPGHPACSLGHLCCVPGGIPASQGAAAGTSGPPFPGQRPLHLGGHLSMPSPIPGALCSVHWCLCPGRPCGLCRSWGAGGGSDPCWGPSPVWSSFALLTGGGESVFAEKRHQSCPSRTKRWVVNQNSQLAGNLCL